MLNVIGPLGGRMPAGKVERANPEQTVGQLMQNTTSVERTEGGQATLLASPDDESEIAIMKINWGSHLWSASVYQNL